jgi:hypothetical protein
MTTACVRYQATIRSVSTGSSSSPRKRLVGGCLSRRHDGIILSDEPVPAGHVQTLAKVLETSKMNFPVLEFLP